MLIKRKTSEPALYADSEVGATNRNRTDDLILTKDVLYHLSHSSVFNNAKVLYTFYPMFVNCYFIKGGMNCVFCSYRLILSKLAFGFSFKVIRGCGDYKICRPLKYLKGHLGNILTFTVNIYSRRLLAFDVHLLAS